MIKQINRNEIMDLVGADSWEWVENAYGDEPLGYIVGDMYYMFPDAGDANDQLAQAIHRELKK